MSNIGLMCGSGSHPACTGIGLHHFDDPDSDNNVPFTCACGCHYVPNYLGTVYVVVPGAEEQGTEEEIISARELEEVEVEPEPEEVSA